MARYKEGFYIRVFVKGSSEISTEGNWVRIYCGTTQEELDQKKAEYKHYLIEELGYSVNEIIQNSK